MEPAIRSSTRVAPDLRRQTRSSSASCSFSSPTTLRRRLPAGRAGWKFPSRSRRLRRDSTGRSAAAKPLLRPAAAGQGVDRTPPGEVWVGLPRACFLTLQRQAEMLRCVEEGAFGDMDEQAEDRLAALESVWYEIIEAVNAGRTTGLLCPECNR